MWGLLKGVSMLVAAHAAAPVGATILTLNVDATVSGIHEDGDPATSPFFSIGSAASFTLIFDTAQVMGIGGRPGVASLALLGTSGEIAIGDYRNAFQGSPLFGEGSTSVGLLLENNFNGADEQDFTVGNSAFSGAPPFPLVPGETPRVETIALEQRDTSQTAIDELSLADLQTDPSRFVNSFSYFFATRSANSAADNGYDVSLARPVITFTSGVPEPAAWAMMLAGFGIIGAALRRDRRRAVTLRRAGAD